MTDAMRRLLRRAEIQGAGPVSAQEARRWGPGAVDRFVDLGLLRNATPARCIRYDGCDHGCTIEPEIITHAMTGERFGVHRCMEGCGLVRIPLDELRRWEFDLLGAARAVARAIDAGGQVVQDVPGRVVLAGTVGVSMRTVDVFVATGLTRDDAPTMLLSCQRLQVAQEPFVFTLATMPPATIWPGGMRPAVAVLAEHARIGPAGLVLDFEPLLALESIPHHRASTPRWLRNKEAAERLQEVVSGVTLPNAKARVSAAGKRGSFRTNGQTGDELRIETASFMDWLWKQRAADLAEADKRVEDKPPKQRLGAMASAPRARRASGND